MKPISISIEGINSFIEKQIISFEFGENLFCISGMTGSGKTTIIDCIILALYGEGKRGQLGDYVNLKSKKGIIEFVFDIEKDGKEKRYEVKRVIPREGSSRAKLVCVTDGTTIAEQTNSVNSMLNELIGLGVDDFTQVVILEQGKFGKFLSAKARERNETVGNLFKLNAYKNLGSKFSILKKQSNEKFDELQKTLAYLIDLENELKDNKKELEDVRNAVNQKTVQEKDLFEEIKRGEVQKDEYTRFVAQKKKNIENHVELGRICAELEKTEKKIGELSAENEKEETERTLISAQLARADSAAQLIPEYEAKKKEIEGLKINYNRIAEEEKQLIKIDKELAETEIQFKSEIEEIADFFVETTKYCDENDLIRIVPPFIKEYEDSREQMQAAEEECKTLDGKMVVAQNKSLFAQKGYNEAESQRNELEKSAKELAARLEMIKSENAVAALTARLKEGDNCPICGGKLKAEHLRQGKDDNILALEQQLKNYNEQISAIAKKLKDAIEFAAAAATEVDSFITSLKAAKEKSIQAKGVFEVLQNKLAKGRQIEELKKTFADFEKHAADRVRGRLNAAVSQEKLKNITKEKEQCINLGKTVREGKERLEEQIKELQKFGTSEELRNKLNIINERIQKNSTEKENAVTEKNSLTGKAEVIKSQIAEFEQIKECVFDEERFLQRQAEYSQIKEELRELTAKEGTLTEKIDRVSKEVGKKAETEAKAKAEEKRFKYLVDIYHLVNGDKFVEFISEEYIHRFTHVASKILSSMTSGKYSLEYDGAFFVKDFLAGSEKRKISTLSGGETFLASLSLAIAISSEISRYKNFDFFLLDEGFGTLDEESLDSAFEALDVLSRHSLVGVITHRTEIVEKINQRLEVFGADAVNGSRVKRVE